jgi:hypothetical protein
MHRIRKQTNKLKSCYVLTLGLLLNSFLPSVIEFIQKYIFADVDIAIFIAILITLDTGLGVWKGLKYNRFSSFRFNDVIEKVVLYGIFLIFVHICTHFNEGKSWLSDWFDTVGYSIVIVREGISLIENIGAIRPNILPAWILKRLKDFDEKGKFISSQPQAAINELSSDQI